MRFFICLVAFLVAPLPSYAQALQANGCPVFKPPVIMIERLYKRPVIDHAETLDTIRKITVEKREDVALGPNETPVGLTAASLKIGSGLEVETRGTQASPMTCSQITKLTIVFGFDDTIIYMPRELPKRTCSYAAVLAHENKHVLTDQAFVERMIAPLQRDMAAVVYNIGVVRAGSQEAAHKKITTQINQAIGELGASYSVMRRNAHKKVDTPEEYARLARACNGELNRFIKNIRKQGVQ